MQFRVAGSVMVLASFAACFPTARDAYKSDVDRTLLVAPTPNRQVAAVGVLTPHPWKIGQWATYRMPEDGYETISVAAVDTCGTWIVDDLTTYHGRVRELVCLREPNPNEPPSTDLVRMVILQFDDRIASVIDLSVRDNAMVSKLRASDGLRNLVVRMLPATWQADTSLRETIDVPAGHFEMTIRTADTIETKPVTRWAHPDVPFDGTVWIKQADGQSYVLMAYGETGAPSIMPELAAPAEKAAATGRASAKARRPRFRDYVAMGATSSWFTGLAGEQSTGADGLEVQDGIAMTSALDIVPGLAWSKLDHYSPDPALREQTMRFTFGFHWRPFATDTPPAAVSLENLYVLADLGYARLDRGMGSTMDEVTSGFVAGAGVGWTWRATRGLGLSAEVSDHALFFTNDDITAHNLAASLLVDVYPFWR
jgi:hypothetical protein